MDKLMSQIQNINKAHTENLKTLDLRSPQERQDFYKNELYKQNPIIELIKEHGYTTLDIENAYNAIYEYKSDFSSKINGDGNISGNEEKKIIDFLNKNKGKLKQLSNGNYYYYHCSQNITFTLSENKVFYRTSWSLWADGRTFIIRDEDLHNKLVQKIVNFECERILLT